LSNSAASGVADMGGKAIGRHPQSDHEMG
jgi:hypothetical protein